MVEIPAVDRVTKRKHGSRGGGRPPLRGVGERLVFKAVDIAWFLGYYVSEGNPDRAGVQLAQSDGRYVEDIRNALSVFPSAWVKEKLCSKSPSDKVRWRKRYKWFVYHLGLAEWLRREVGEGAYHKRLPSAVFNWPRDAQYEFLIGLLNGDGHWVRSKTKTSALYVTRSEGLGPAKKQPEQAVTQTEADPRRTRFTV